MPPTTTAKSAQKALFLIFALLGIMGGFWAASIPLLQTRLSLTTDILGLAIFCFGLGAVLATFVVPKLIARYHTRTVMMISGTVMWIAFPLTINAPSVNSLLFWVLITGFGCGSLDASMNSHAFNVEHHLQKPSMSLFHGGFSLGNIIGSALAALFIYLNLPHAVCMYISSVLAICLLWQTKRFCYDQDIQPDASNNIVSSNQRIPKSLIILAILTGISFFAEGAIGDWSGLFLRDIKSASATQAALTLGAFASGMTIGRFLGDSWRARYSTMRLLFVSSVVASVMMLLFIVSPNAPLALLALACAGLGYANIVPMLFVRAGETKGISASRAVAFTAGMGYASLLGGPALLGYLALEIGLTWAFSVVVVGNIFLCLESAYAIKKQTR